MSPPKTLAPSHARTFLGGVLMGLANLVPGISGGTMILAVGLYDAFIGAVADVSRLRITRRSVTFLGVMTIGRGLAGVPLSGVGGSRGARPPPRREARAMERGGGFF